MPILRFLLPLLLLGFLATSQAAEDLKPSESNTKDAIRAVITAQLEAFRHGDYAAAYIFADSDLKQQISPQNFERMVRRAYPAIAHSSSAKFGLAFDNGDDAVINVRVFRADGEPVDYRYSLRRAGDDWRITGVTLLKAQTTEV